MLSLIISITLLDTLSTNLFKSSFLTGSWSSSDQDTELVTVTIPFQNLGTTFL